MQCQQVKSVNVICRRHDRRETLLQRLAGQGRQEPNGPSMAWADGGCHGGVQTHLSVSQVRPPVLNLSLGAGGGGGRARFDLTMLLGVTHVHVMLPIHVQQKGGPEWPVSSVCTFGSCITEDQPTCTCLYLQSWLCIWQLAIGKASLQPQHSAILCQVIRQPYMRIRQPYIVIRQRPCGPSPKCTHYDDYISFNHRHVQPTQHWVYSMSPCN